MKINSISVNYTNNIPKRNLNLDNTTSNKGNVITADKSINKINVGSPYPSGMTPIDKGTAKGTTINVDRSTIFSIINYAVNNTETSGFEELGMDDNKRWVVINGQRFESELSPEEKELIRKAKEGNTLLSYIKESDDKKFERKENEKIQMNFNDSNVELPNNTKIQNLLGNDKVMSMLSSIFNYNPIKQ